MLSKALKWPVISLLIVGGIHFTAEAILPGLREIFVPAVVAPLLLVFGLWVGYKMVQFGGHYGHVMLAGALLGVLPALLDVVGFGVILGRGIEFGLLAGTLGCGMILFGSLIGGGFALSK